MPRIEGRLCRPINNLFTCETCWHSSAWRHNEKLENVAKADQIVDKVKAIIEKHRKIDSLLNLSLTVAYNFHKDELPQYYGQIGAEMEP